MIEVNSLTKTYTVHKKQPGLIGSIRSLVWRKKLEKHAVKGVSLQVNEGEIVGLIGANGAGKTTLVKMLAGIIFPTSGDARVLGHRPWKRENEYRRQIALIMGQKAQLWWDLPAADCFLLLKEIYQIPHEVYTERLNHLSEVLDIKDELNIQIRRLSLGERMKMELIAALLHRPRVVFLDEPTIGLDITAQRAIREFILEYREEHKPAMILTSHYMEDIERLCKRIIIIREGEFVYDGSLAQVVSDYAPNKLLTCHLLPDAADDHLHDGLEKIGEVKEASNEIIRIAVRRNEVPAAAAELLRRYPIADLTIEEPEIGTIIEKIMQDREESLS